MRGACQPSASFSTHWCAASQKGEPPSGHSRTSQRSFHPIIATNSSLVPFRVLHKQLEKSAIRAEVPSHHAPLEDREEGVRALNVGLTIPGHVSSWL
jgi:hypothetical protein